MAKKKPSTRTTPVRIETGLVRKMVTIAQDRGIDLSDYVTGTLRGPVEKDWCKVLRKLVDDQNEGDRP
ncbi:MAG: hypothetical protein KGR26_09075 [Cyanobacteria bacterium REEB65]|nr:hypothetical protein [Cyanobacteria bacterium REEB65]